MEARDVQEEYRYQEREDDGRGEVPVQTMLEDAKTSRAERKEVEPLPV